MAGFFLKMRTMMNHPFLMILLALSRFNINYVVGGCGKAGSIGEVFDWENYGSFEAVQKHTLQTIPIPSSQTPFLFLHVPKTGGSTIRKQLIDVGVRFNIGGERMSPIGGYKVKIIYNIYTAHVPYITIYLISGVILL